MTTGSARHPPRVFPAILVLLALPMALGGLQLVFPGGSFYYLLAGLALFACGIRVWRKDPMASYIYGGLLLVTAAWALMEAGTHLWALAPRILPLAVIGTWFLMPTYRKGVYGGNPPPLFAGRVSLGVSAVLTPVAIYVIVDGVGWEVAPLAPRGGVNTVTANTDWPSYGNDLGGSRFSPLNQINTGNVMDLERAWTYRTGAGGAFKATPLQTGELLYFCTDARLIALDATTGERWSFQTTHHDIWDYDVPSQPVLIDLPGENGEKIPAVLVPTKRAEVFVLNRATGEPLFDIQKLPVPQEGAAPGEWVADTQPFAVDLPNFRPDLSEAKMWGVTPLDQLWCRIEFRRMRYEGHFTVPGIGTILQFPGNYGGHNRGSVSVDRVNNIMVVNPIVMANQLTLRAVTCSPTGFRKRMAYSKH